MNKMKVFCLLFIPLLTLTGCWDQRELSEISLAMGMAIDVGEKAKYKMTVEAINAAELNEQTAGGNSPTVLFSLEGNTIVELAHKLNIGFSRRILYSHMKTVVISEEIGKKGMLDFLDFLERNREIRDDFNFMVAREGKASDILEVLYLIQKSSSLKLKAQLETAANLWGSDPEIKLSAFLRAVLSSGRQPVLAAVRVEGDNKKGASVDNMTKSRPDAMVVIDSMAIFRGDKIEGYLSIEDTRNYLWLDNKLNTTIVSVPCGEGNNYFAFRVSNSKTKLKGKLNNGVPNIKADINIEGYLSTNQCNETLDKHETFLNFQKKAEQYLKSSLNKTVHKTQKEYGLDIFGFGEVVERNDYKEFQKIKDKWFEIYKDANVDINVTVNLTRPGLNTRGSLRDIEK